VKNIKFYYFIFLWGGRGWVGWGVNWWHALQGNNKKIGANLRIFAIDFSKI
jgi:hypothetical protein